jgi:hypothetical protein
VSFFVVEDYKEGKNNDFEMGYGTQKIKLFE